MCQPASFVLTPTKVLWSRRSDKHEDIIAEHQSAHRLDDRNEPPNFVRVEIVPPHKTDFAAPVKDWVFHVDQDRLPEWFDENEAEIATRVELPSWCAAKLIRAGETRDVNDGNHFVAICGGTVDEIRGGTVAEICGGTVNVISGGTVGEIRGGAVNVISGGTVGEIRGGAVNVISGGTVAAICGGTVAAICGGTVAEIWGGMVDVIKAGTVSKLLGGLTRFHCKFSVTIAGKRTVAVDMTGETAICHVGEKQERTIAGGVILKQTES
jgi:hypothetical protein